jgi:proline iminopeptidase
LTSEGFIAVSGGRVWYQVAGEGGPPFLCLHGGPGFTHNYIRSLIDLAGDRPVVLYDQLGCGRSDRPNDKSLWRIERFVDEVEAVVEHLALEDFHLFGSSWGAMLACQYILDKQPGVMSLVLAGAPLDMPRYRRELLTLVEALPKDVKSILAFHEEHGFYDCPEYQGATAFFMKRHLCRMDPWPLELEQSFAGIGLECFREMAGPSETAITGNIKDFNVFPWLSQIRVPTLVTCGRFDNVVVEHASDTAAALPRGELAVFEKSGHMPFLEERESYMRTVSDFLRRAEGASTSWF